MICPPIPPMYRLEFSAW